MNFAMHLCQRDWPKMTDYTSSLSYSPLQYFAFTIKSLLCRFPSPINFMISGYSMGYKIIHL